MKYFILTGLIFTLDSTQAQWSQTGSNVYLTTDSDNVGIGTNSPASKFHIKGSNAVFKISSTTGAQYLNIYHDGSTGAHIMSTSSSGSFTLFNYGENHVFKTWQNNQWEEKLRISSTGNLGEIAAIKEILTQR